MKKMYRVLSFLVVAVMLVALMAGCSGKKETVVIYTCANETRVAEMGAALSEQFPDYEIIVEYMGTGNLSAKLLAEGKNTDCDIVHDLSYLTLASLDEANVLADVSFIDTSVFLDSTNVSDHYVIECTTSGAVILNNKVMEERGLPTPASYDDLLKPEYKGLISMPDPKSSGTGYMFYKSLVNAWGEEKAVEYFRALSENVLQFTSSGNGPVNALVQEEVAIGLGMTNNAVTQMRDNGMDFTLLFFEEGAPYTMYGQTIIAGREEDAVIREVFEYMVNVYLPFELERDGAEQVYKDKVFTSPPYPENVTLSDMSNDTNIEKERLLALWDIT